MRDLAENGLEVVSSDFSIAFIPLRMEEGLASLRHSARGSALSPTPTAMGQMVNASKMIVPSDAMLRSKNGEKHLISFAVIDLFALIFKQIFP